MDNQMHELVDKTSATLAMVLLSILVIGTALIPAVLARKYGWVWLLVYPVSLLAFVGYGSFKKRMK